jgi:glycosyltransferase involved in cell wall biosynthesis
MKVSLVTTVRNEAHGAAELVRSIGAQTRPPDQWLVVDGGSTDDTVEIFAAEPSCTVITEPGNIAHGRNVGIARAEWPVVAVIDAGCVAEPGWLEQLVAPLEGGEVDIATGSTTPRIERPFDASQWILLDQFVHPRLRDPAVSSRSVAFVRRVWERCRYPEWLDHSEDAWLFEQWRRLGLRTVRVPNAKVEWRLRSSPGAWVRQHFRYMHGQGRAALFSGRNWMRVLFYAVVLGLCVGGVFDSRLLVGGVAAWAVYAAATLVRFPGATASRGLGFRIATLAWLPAMLLTMDGAKIVGWLAGRVDRWTAARR